MNSSSFIPTNDIRLQFTLAMSDMYQTEVPQYKQLLALANKVNQKAIQKYPENNDNHNHLLALEHHGAIRVGTANELFMVRRLFAVMGMQPVDYYDLSVAGIPVHSTAFRALQKDDLDRSPFRVFCSLLRLDLIDDQKLKQQAEQLLNKRVIFPDKLLKLIGLAEKQGGLGLKQSKDFIQNALDVFRWHENATVDKHTYNLLKKTHGLVADVVSFRGPHINHLTPKVLDIDECQNQFINNNIKAKAIVEGPPRRKCPILLRQTSFVAIAEQVTFSDGEIGSHTARFGEVEQRGVALTPKGRELYDRLLMKARNANETVKYSIRLNEAFKGFPDDFGQIRKQKLAYFKYYVNHNKQYINTQADDVESLILNGIIEVKPIIYEDFLPVSAAGIFTSNLSESATLDKSVNRRESKEQNVNLSVFEEALGVPVENSFELYEAQQQTSLTRVLSELGIIT